MSENAERQRDLAEDFHRLHVRGRPLVLFNVWDPGSAHAVTEAGARAIATGSWSVAAAFGYADGERTPLELVVDNARRIAAATPLPVTIDFEGAYAVRPADVARNVARLLSAGIVGINFEDRIVAGGGLHPIAEQTARIAAIRQSADESGVPFFINARTDLFLQSPRDSHTRHVDEAIERATAYAGAGASGFFVPGLCDEAAIGRVASEVPLPLNVMVMPGLPAAGRLAELGVARISHGPGPYRGMIEALKRNARTVFAA